MNWAALLLITLGALGLLLAVSGNPQAVGAWLFGTPQIWEATVATHLGAKLNTQAPAGSPSPAPTHDPGANGQYAAALAQLQTALAAYAPGSVVA